MKKEPILIYMIYVSSVDGITNIASFYKFLTFEDLRGNISSKYITDEILKCFVNNNGYAKFMNCGIEQKLKIDRMFLNDNRL
jgi:hypothetical protein